jgi:hypothetical protein
MPSVRTIFSDQEPSSARRLRALAVVVVIVLVAMLGIVSLAFVFRGAIASALIESYLAGQGVRAQVTVSQLGLRQAAAEATLGEAREFSAQQIVVVYGDFPFATRVRAVRLVRPVLRVGFDGKRFSLGSLQHFVDTQSRQKRTGPMPEVAIQDGRALVDTPGGTITLVGGGEWRGTRQAQFRAAILPATVRSKPISANLSAGEIDVHPAGRALEASATLAGSFAIGALDWRADNAVLSIALHGLTLGDLVQSVRAEQGRAEFFATDLVLPNATLEKVAANLDLKALNGGYANGALQGSVALDFVGSAATATLAGSTFTNLVTALGLSARANDGKVDLQGTLSSRALLDAKAAANAARAVPIDDAGLRTGIANAMKTLTLHVPDWRITHASAESKLVLGAPMTLSGADGASLTVTALPPNPVLSVAQGKTVGAAAIALHGPGLPSLGLRVTADREGGSPNFNAAWDGEASLDAYGAKGLSLSGSGRATGSPGRVAVFLDHCRPAKLARYVANGREMIAGATGALCPSGSEPLVEGVSTGWRFVATWKDLSASLPSAAARLEHSAGQVELKSERGGALTGTIDIRASRLVDAAAQRRFNPLEASGRLALADQNWKGPLTVTVGNRKNRLGTVQIVHSLKDGRGSADIEAQNLSFTPEGLQPTALSTLLVAVQRANGTARFSGHVNWTAHAMTSDGQLDIDKLEFLSPLGHATEAGTHLHFTSLLPPRTADNQPVSVALVDWFTPLANSSARITWNEKGLHLEQAKSNAAQGTLVLDPLTISFVPGGTTRGEIRLDQIDLATLVAASNLSDKMSVEGRIAGDIPLSFGPSGMRFINGAIRLVGPGRLSINRSVWGETDATIAAGGAMRDLAYQALEHLAVDEMDGKLNSLDNGRLGLLLHIKGRNDPSADTETRVGIVDLLRGQAFDKPLTLPKGTPIELTLDLSLNFDQLLAAYRSAWANAAASAIVTSK